MSKSTTKRIKKVKAWAILDTKDRYQIPFFDAGYLKSVPYQKVWAIFSTESEAKNVLKISKIDKSGVADKYTKVFEVEIFYSLPNKNKK